MIVGGRSAVAVAHHRKSQIISVSFVCHLGELKGDNMSPEKKKGYDAYFKGKTIGSNPFVWTDQTWWMVEDWDAGWKEAEADDIAYANDDDY